MVHLWIPFIIATQVPTPVSAPEPVQVRYTSTTVGRKVTVILDGQEKRTTFAGKLAFEDATGKWRSVCADIRSPINPGLVFPVQSRSSKSFGGNVAKAGNIVAKYFATAKSPDECAGLQLAVWEAMEDGNPTPDYSAGHFQVKATSSILNLAQQYYQAIGQDGDAIYLQQFGRPGGGGQGPGGFRGGPGGGPGGPGGPGGGQGQFRGGQ